MLHDEKPWVSAHLYEVQSLARELRRDFNELLEGVGHYDGREGMTGRDSGYAVVFGVCSFRRGAAL